MTNFEFLQLYRKLQKGIMLDKFVDLGFTEVCYCSGDTSAFWNYALVNEILTDQQVKQVEQAMVTLSRPPAFYFENRSSLNSLIDKLNTLGYAKQYEDCWLFHPGTNIDNQNFSSVKKVQSETELKSFLDVFNACYQKDDPQNPYGELGGYLQVTEKVWHKHQGTNYLEYFIVYSDNKPVAVSTLTNYKEIGYISNVGSLRQVRGKGFGKAATLYCIDQSIKHGNTQHCLATEEGNYPYEFYTRLGFEQRFSALGHVKK